MMWKFEHVKLVTVEKLLPVWTWVPVPPLKIVKEFMRIRVCDQCGSKLGPFPVIGMLEDGRYMAFSKPPQLLRIGDVAGVLEVMKPQEIKAPTRPGAEPPPPQPAQPAQNAPVMPQTTPNLQLVQQPPAPPAPPAPSVSPPPTAGPLEPKPQ